MRESSPHLHNMYDGSIHLEEKERRSKGRERGGGEKGGRERWREVM